MIKEFFTVVQKHKFEVVKRFGSFVNESDAQELFKLKAPTINDLEVVRSDLYHSLQDYFDDEILQLVESATRKLTAEELSAMKSHFIK